MALSESEGRAMGILEYYFPRQGVWQALVKFKMLKNFKQFKER